MGDIMTKFIFAFRTKINHHIIILIEEMEDRLLSIGPAICAIPVRGLSRGIIEPLVYIYANIRNDECRFMITLCLRPLFKLRYLLYQFIFFMQQKRMFLLHQKSILLYGEQYLKNFGDSFISLNLGLERAYALCKVIGGFGGSIK